MRTRCIAGLVAAAGLGLACGASAQVDMYLVNQQDIGLLSDITAANYPQFFIGRNPSAVAFTGTDVYVAGSNFAGGEQIQVVRINDALGTRSFTEITATIATVTVGSHGYNGMDWDAASRRLLTSRRSADVGGVAIPFEILEFDATNAFVGYQTSPPNVTFGSQVGPAWDYGADGAGFDYLPFDPPDFTVGDGVDDGPVPSVLPWSQTQVIGLFEGLAADDSDYILNSTFNFAYSDLGGPAILIQDPLDPTNTLWRDFDVHPTNGTIAARAANQLLISPRNADDTAVQIAVTDRNTAPMGLQAFSAGQNCEILDGLPGGDAVIWNDRWNNDPGKPFDVVQQVTGWTYTDIDGDMVPDLVTNNLSVNWLAADGTPLTFGPRPVEPTDPDSDIYDGNGWYSYSWHAPSQTLAVADFFVRQLYFFSPNQPASPCPCDLDGAPGVDVFDLLAYLSLWFPQDPGADIDGTPGVDVFDLLEFLSCWFPASAGAPCP